MKRTKKSGQIWISAVIFITLGIIAISLILAAAIPLVEKIKDKNTVIQTKEILLKLDDAVRTVINEGPGSQRQLTPLIIDEGKLIISNGDYKFLWEIETEALLMEKDIEITEGNIHQTLNSTFVEEVSLMKLWVESQDINTTLTSSYTGPLKGKYTIVLKHTGTFDPSTDNPIIQINVI